MSRCPNPYCYRGFVPLSNNESKAAPPIDCRHPGCPHRRPCNNDVAALSTPPGSLLAALPRDLTYEEYTTLRLSMTVAHWERVKAKARWEAMTPWAVLNEWTDLRKEGS